RMHLLLRSDDACPGRLAPRGLEALGTIHDRQIERGRTPTARAARRAEDLLFTAGRSISAGRSGGAADAPNSRLADRSSAACVRPANARAAGAARYRSVARTGEAHHAARQFLDHDESRGCA